MVKVKNIEIKQVELEICVLEIDIFLSNIATITNFPLQTTFSVSVI